MNRKERRQLAARRAAAEKYPTNTPEAAASAPEPVATALPEAPSYSTGPRTEAGKAISSHNALKHGLASGTLFIPGEDPAEYDSLLKSLLNDQRPVGENEALLVRDMATATWLKDRAIRLQAAAFANLAAHPGTSPVTSGVPPELSVLIRYQTTNERAYHRAFKTLADLRKQRLAASREFVSQNAADPTGPLDEFVSKLPPDRAKTVSERLRTPEETILFLSELEQILGEALRTGEDPIELHARVFGQAA
jgi:hypothetical protein